MNGKCACGNVCTYITSELIEIPLFFFFFFWVGREEQLEQLIAGKKKKNS